MRISQFRSKNLGVFQNFEVDKMLVVGKVNKRHLYSRASIGGSTQLWEMKILLIGNENKF